MRCCLLRTSRPLVRSALRVPALAACEFIDRIADFVASAAEFTLPGVLRGDAANLRRHDTTCGVTSTARIASFRRTLSCSVRPTETPGASSRSYTSGGTGVYCQTALRPSFPGRYST